MALRLNISNLKTPTLLGNLLGVQGVNELYIKITEYHAQESNCKIKVEFFNLIEETIGEEIIQNKIKLNIPTSYYDFTIVEDGSEQDVNTRQQGYNFLKNLSEFADCEDC